MKRRNFVNAVSAMLLGAKFISVPDSSPEVSISIPKTKNENQIILTPGTVFVLPENPNPLETIFFSPGNNDWKPSSPIVQSKSHLIMGVMEPVIADANISFGLKFVDKKSGWIFFQIS